LGSTRLITDESGNVVTEMVYRPFGEPTVTGEEDHFLYNGKERDSSGLYYYGVRYYDPETGRFTTRDPKTGKTHQPQTLNRYVYCLNNPLKYVDPVGLDSDDAQTDLDELLEQLKKLLEEAGIDTDAIEFVEAFFANFADLLLDSNLLALLDTEAFATVYMMAFLETVVELYGEELGITGAFLGIEGLAAGGLGVQGGVALVFHPDLGWAAFAYGGFMWGAMYGASVSIVGGFYTWHGSEDFTFRAWAGEFFSLEASAGIWISGSWFYFKDDNTPAKITGWGAGAGISNGPGGGVAGVRTWWTRIRRESLPFWLQGTVVPQ
jgi:RHS repeat-associated protein